MDWAVSVIRTLLTLTLILEVSHASAQEITLDHITAAVCQVESGVIWEGPGIVSGRFILGGSGELGPWQAMPYTVSALGRSEGRNRSSVHYAETTFRIWYSRLLQKHGSHAEALAAYHRGSAGRHRKDAKAYAERCMNLAERLAKEAKQ